MWTIVGFCVVCLALSLMLTNATDALNAALLIMLYTLAPWTAVNLTDYFLVRHGHYAIADLFTLNGIYGAWSWRGITAMLLGIIAEIPFVELSFLNGWVAAALGVDIAFAVGLLVSSLAYWIFTRTLDVAGESSSSTATPTPRIRSALRPLPAPWSKKTDEPGAPALPRRRDRQLKGRSDAARSAKSWACGRSTT